MSMAEAGTQSLTPLKRDSNSASVGANMMDWATDLFPICRSLTGEGVRQTLAYLAELIPGLTVHAVPSGSQAFDWTVPQEWSIHSGRLIGPDGDILVDFENSNLHVVGYSQGIDRTMNLEELQPHLYSLPSMPDAVPYITTYYAPDWGFCMSDRQRQALKPGDYRAMIDAEHFDGVLNYGEIVIPGSSSDEVLLSTYVCHPSMANNELSGPVLATALARWVQQSPRRLTYRIVFVPETIGSIVYLSKHLDHLKRHVVAGFTLTCVGDDGPVSFVPTPSETTLADRTAEYVLHRHAPDHLRYSFLDRGSDERQYCSPLVDLPVASVMRSKYGCYDAYHTSLDNLEFISAEGLARSFDLHVEMLTALEQNQTYRNVFPCEPQLGKRGLYPSVSTKDTHAEVALMKNIIAYSDGRNDLLWMAEKFGAELSEMSVIADQLCEAGVLTRRPTEDHG
jgi:aminopeptidase-like protein